jgi:ATP-dependent protease ClpP protease subunit
MPSGHIYIYGEVGKQVTLDTVLKEIDPKFSDYIVHVHSPGGDVFEGYAIYNAIKNTGKNITVQIEGVCASIATLIASAGSKIIMNTKSQFMVHNPKITSVSGDHKELRNVAAQLERIKTQLIQSWLDRTSLSEQELSKMYDNETWLTPEQAKDLGFVDEVQEVLKAVASADPKNYKHMEDKKTILSQITKMLNQLFASDEKSIEPKNVTDTLADGTVIIVESEDGDWAGKRVTYEDGSPLPPGDHALAGERLLVVGEGGVISEVKESQPEDTNTQEMEALKKLEAAEARIKELESALEAQSTTAAEAVAKAKTFENKLNIELPQLKAQIDKLTNTTVGDTKLPDRGTKKTFDMEGKPVHHPLADFFKEKVTNVRNTD